MEILENCPTDFNFNCEKCFYYNKDKNTCKFHRWWIGEDSTEKLVPTKYIKRK